MNVVFRRNSCLAVFAAAILASASYAAHAGIIFTTGNAQYTNVNIAADTNALTIVGDIGNTGIQFFFENMIGPDGSTQVEMHGQHGVAFVESFADSLPGATHTGFSSLTLAPEAGFGFTAGDFSLDQLNSLLTPTGSITFVGTDQFGNPTSTTLSIAQNGQNPYNFTTTGGELVTQIVLTVPLTDLLQDIKQVSVDVVPLPEPGTIALLGLTFVALGFARRRKQH